MGGRRYRRLRIRRYAAEGYTGLFGQAEGERDHPVNEAVKELAERVPEDAYPIILIWGHEGQAAMLPLGIHLDKLPAWLIRYAAALEVEIALMKHKQH